MAVEFLVMGPVEARRDGAPIALGGLQQRRLLSVLLCAPGEVLTADRLSEAIWPDGRAPEGARRALHTYISRLRAVLDDGMVVTHAEGYVLDLGASTLDAAEFERLVEVARHAPPTRRISCLDQALALWRGPAFGELGAEWWARPMVSRFEELRLGAAEDRIDTLLEVGEPERAMSDAEELVATHPLRERPVELLARAQLATGRQAEALRSLHDFRRRLADRTGLDPSASISDLEHAIAAGSTGARRPERSARGYSLGDVLGEGSFGTVFRASQPGVGREVAVKVVRAELADDPAFVRSFEAEAQLVARLEHPHIVPLYDFWREPGGAYLVFRLMRGGSAEQALLSEGAWPVDRVTRLVEQIGGALSAAHAAGVVHRDVKPANVLFDEAGNAHLADFGIASVDDAPYEPPGPYSAGSPLYASPEQFQRSEVTARSDLYSFAVMVWELLAGHAPHEGESASQLSRLKLERPAPSLAAVRPDLAPALDPVLRTATAPDPAHRFSTATEFVLAWHAAIATRSPTSATASGVLAPRARMAQTVMGLPSTGANPYKGLRAFGEADSRDYHGRTALVDALERRVVDHRVTTVVGASGSGKSSLLQAGLVPRLRAQGARIVGMVPGERPSTRLRDALLQVATRPLHASPERAVDQVAREAESDLVVVIDQFEELWTLASDAERDRFVALLADAAGGDRRVRIVLGLRADVFDRPLADPALGPVIATGVFTVTPMTTSEVAEAVRAPANAVGVTFEPGLDAELVADVVGQPSALPMLQFALAELYERRDRALIPAEAYRQLGGVAGAIAARADAVYEDLDPDERHAARRLFGRLVTPGAGSDDTRRRVRRGSLPPDVDRVADVFVEHRLLVVDRDPTTREPTLDIAHEALLRSWPLLSSWLDEDRERLRVLQHLSRATDEWQAGGRREGDLYRGPRLVATSEIVDSTTTGLTGPEREFLDASVAARDALVAAERSRVEHQARQNRRLRRTLVVAAVTLVLALLAGTLAVQQRRRAVDSAAAAEAGEADATASFVDAELRRVALEAPTLAEAQPDLGLLLAVQSNRLRPGTETDSALLASLQANPAVRRMVDVGLPADDRIHGIAGVAPGPLVAVDGETAVVIDGESLAPTGVRWPLDTVATVAVNPSGTEAATADRDGKVERHDLATGERRGEVVQVAPGATFGQAVPIAYVGDDTIAVADGSDVEVYPGGATTPARTIPFAEPVGLLSASPDGTRLVVGGSRSAHAQLLDLRGGPTTDLGAGLVSVATFAPGDRLHLAVLRDGVSASIDTRDSSTGALVASAPLPGHTSVGLRIVPLEAGGLLYQSALLEVAEVDPSLTSVHDVSFATVTGGLFLGVTGADGTSVVGSLGGRLVVLDPHGTPLPLTELPVEGSAFPRSVGDRLVVSSTHGAQLLDARTLAPLGPDIPELANMLALSGDASPDASYAAGRSFAAGPIRVFETTSGRLLGDPIPVDDGVQNGGAPRFSPDGRFLAMGDSTGVAVYSIPELELVRHVDISAQLALAIEWSPDGRWLTFVDITTGAHLVDLDSGDVTALDGTWNTFTTGGRLVEFPAGESLRVIDPGTGSLEDTLPAFRELSSGVTVPGTSRILRSTTSYVDLVDLDAGTRVGEPLAIEPTNATLSFSASVDSTGDHALIGFPGLPLRRLELDRGRWTDAACDTAGRNLTRAEWTQYFGPAGLPYEATCPQYPPGP